MRQLPLPGLGSFPGGTGGLVVPRRAVRPLRDSGCGAGGAGVPGTEWEGSESLGVVARREGPPNDRSPPRWAEVNIFFAFFSYNIFI